MILRRALLGGVVALLAVTLAPALVPSPTASGPREAAHGAGYATDWVALASSDGPRALGVSQTVMLTLTLRPSHPAELAAFTRQVITPGSSEYRHFLTESQYEATFAPAASDLAAVHDYFAGFQPRSITETPDRSAVVVVLPMDRASQALGTEFVTVSVRGGATHYSTLGPPKLPEAIASRLVGIGGLSNAANSLSSALLQPVHAGKVAARPMPGSIVVDQTSGNWWFTGSDYAQAYGASRLFPPSTAVTNATYPLHEAIATILMSGFNASLGQNLPPWDPDVLSAYFNDTLGPGWPAPVVSGVPVTIGGLTPPRPGNLSSVNDTSFNEAENSLDLEMAGSLAPGATLVNFYFAASLFEATGNGPLGPIADDFAQCLSSALSHPYGTAQLAAVTNSFGLPDLNDTLWNQELVHAAAIGVTVVASSGDQGNAPTSLSGRFQGQWPSWPASAAFETSGTLAVGGASVNVSGQPTSFYSGSSLNVHYNPGIGSPPTQVSWYDVQGGPGNFSGTEGGVSTSYAEPAWQFHSAAQPAIANASSAQGVARLGRSEPDVAFAANSTIAYVAADRTGLFFDVLEGTSVSAPLFAGMIADWAAVDGHPFGYLAPELYRIGSYVAQRGGPGSPFLDVVAGSNYAFGALAGWDATTGWGGIDAVAFLSADANRTLADWNYTGPTPGLPPPTFGRLPATPTVALIALAVVGVFFAVVAALVVVLARRRAPPALPPYAVPPGAYGGPWGTAAGSQPPPRMPATFACPYCGLARPAEPGRCPHCGAI